MTFDSQRRILSMSVYMAVSCSGESPVRWSSAHAAAFARPTPGESNSRAAADQSEAFDEGPPGDTRGLPLLRES